MESRRQISSNVRQRPTACITDVEIWNGCASRLPLNTMCPQDSPWRSSEEEGDDEKTVWSVAEGEGDGEDNSSNGEAGQYLNIFFLRAIASRVFRRRWPKATPTASWTQFIRD